MRTLAQKKSQPPQQASFNFIRSSVTPSTAKREAKAHTQLHQTSNGQADARFAHDFSRIPVSAKASGGMQAKLSVNATGDVYEQEAERVADEVMLMPEPPTRRVRANAAGGTSAPPIVHRQLRSHVHPSGAAGRVLQRQSNTTGRRESVGEPLSATGVHESSVLEQEVQGREYEIMSRFWWGLMENVLNIEVRIKFTHVEPGAMVSRWFNGIRQIWNNFHGHNPLTGERVWIRFWPERVGSGEHHSVEVIQSGSGIDQGRWSLTHPRPELIAAHEFGHMIGLEDEYSRTHTDIVRLTGQPQAPQPRPPLPYREFVRQLYDALHHTRPGFERDQAITLLIGRVSPGRYTDLVALSYAANYHVNLAIDFENQMRGSHIFSWANSILFPTTHTIMGTPEEATDEERTHPAEPRHVRHLMSLISRVRDGRWEPRRN
jgi:hypothetical protein